MALKYLELSEMVGLTEAWVGAQRPLLAAIPQVAGWLPQLDDVHARVKRAQPCDTSALDAQVSAITTQQVGIDARHDALVRSTSSSLDAEEWRCVAADPPLAQRAELCERARMALFPKGMLVINALYVAEAGNAARTRALLVAEVWLRELLTSIPTAGGSLLEMVGVWCSLAEELGQLEDQKAHLRARIAGSSHPPRAEILAARNAWLAIVNTILTSFELVDGHTQAIETLRAPVLLTAGFASRRKKGDAKAVGSIPSGETSLPAAPDAPGRPR